LVHRRNFFVTFSVFRCYIVEREKKAGGKSGQTVSGAESRKGGIRMWIMKFY